MLDAMPDHAVKERAMVEAALGRGFAMPDEALFDDPAALEIEKAEPWSR